MKKHIILLTLFSIICMGVFPQSILFLRRHNDAYQVSEDTMIARIRSWGFTVITTQSLSSSAGSYASYDLLVISESIQSSYAIPFKDAGYPIPSVVLEGFAPISANWGWFTTGEEDTYWRQILFSNPDPEDQPNIDYKNTTIVNDDHVIMKVLGKNVGDTINWSNTSNLSDLEITWFDFAGAGKSYGTVLGNITTRNKPNMYAIEPNVDLGTSHRMFMWGIQQNALDATDGSEFTQDFWDVLKYSIMWVNSDFDTSSNAYLSDIKVDGESIEDFDSSVFSYIVLVDYGSTDAPEVSVVLSDPSASFKIDTAKTIPDTTFITVTAQDSVTKNTYQIIFIEGAPSHDPTLSDLKLDGETIEGFSPTTLWYTYMNPFGAAVSPVVSATPTDPNATVLIEQATGVIDTAYVNITAQDSVSKLTYSVAFSEFVGVKELPFQNLRIYPSIVKDNITIELNDYYPNSILRIYSITGENILNKPLMNKITKINLSHLPSGIYLISVRSNEVKVTRRIMKE